MEDGEITAKQNQEDDILSVYGLEDSEITAKQNQEDDTLSCYGSEDGEIASKEEEKEEDSKKIIFKRNWPNIGKKPRKAMPQSAAFDVYSCSHKTIYQGQMERFSLGFKMKMPKGYCAKIYGRSGMTVKHGIHLAGGVSIIEPDFRGPISICLKNSHRSHPYEIKVNDRVAQMMIERVDDFEWIEGTENDFKTEGVSENTSEASENASEAQCGMKRIKKLWRASEVQVFERERERKKMNKLLSQITFTSNKEKISYLNYLPPTIDESSSDMSCKFISCL